MGSKLEAPQCAKCGSDKGWDGPVYGSLLLDNMGYAPITASEWLTFTCRSCGYKRRENTKDYVAPTPSPTPLLKYVFVPECGVVGCGCQSYKSWWRW